MERLKGIGSDSNNNFFDNNQKIITKKRLFPKFIILASNNCLCYINVSKMASSLSQKRLTILVLKSSYFVYFGPYHFVQISQAYGPNTYQILYGETLYFQCQQALSVYSVKSLVSANYNNMMPNRKINFVVNCCLMSSVLQLKILTFGTYLDHMLMKFEQNRMVQNTYKTYNVKLF